MVWSAENPAILGKILASTIRKPLAVSVNISEIDEIEMTFYCYLLRVQFCLNGQSAKLIGSYYSYIEKGIRNFSRRSYYNYFILLSVNSRHRWTFHYYFRLTLGFMISCAFLSMWLSNTSTAAMVMPIVEAVAQQIINAEAEVDAMDMTYANGTTNPALELEGK